jgi:hypothetical protein
MLSDAEQRRLKEIERGLQSEDPGFADRVGHGMERNPRNWPRMTAGWLIAAAWIMGLAVLMASSAMVVIALTLAAVPAALWLADYGSPGDRQPPQR